MRPVLPFRPEFVERLRPLEYTVPTSESPAALAARIRDETPRWEALVRASGARLDRRARVAQPAVARTPDEIDPSARRTRPAADF